MVNILKKNVKTNSFFKVRSGIIGGKVEAEDIGIKDTLTKEQKIHPYSELITNLNELVERFYKISNDDYTYEWVEFFSYKGSE